MDFNKIGVLSLFISIVISSWVYGQQKSEVWFRNFGLEDGLPAKKVNDIKQGSDGFLWLATLNGLVRYDGYEFKSFRIPSDNGFPVGNFTDRLLDDENGKIWVGYYYSNYIGYYDTEEHHFGYIDLAEKLKLDQEARAVRLLGTDAQQNVWVSYYLNLESAIILKIGSKDSSIYPYTQKQDSVFPVSDIYGDYIPPKSLHVAEDSSLWMGANRGILHITPKDSLIIFNSDDEDLADPYVYNLLEMGDEFWLATDKGLMTFDKNGQQFRRIEAPEHLQETEIIHLYKDENGLIWITTDERTYQYAEGIFNRVESEELEALNSPSMLPQVEDERYLWFINKRVYDAGVPMTNGITRYDKGSDVYEVFNSNEIEGLGNIQYISRLFLDRSGSLWIGNFYTGLSQYPPYFKKFETHFTDPNFQDLVGNSFYYQAETTAEGHYIVGTGNGKILVRNVNTGEEKIWAELDPPAFADGRNLVSDFLALKSGVLLVATQMTGLKRITYDPETLDIQEIKTWSMDEVGVGRLSNLVYDDKGNLWVTGLGIAKVDLEANSFEAFHTVSEYDPRYDFGDILEKDSEGKLWSYGFNQNAIKRFDPVTKELKVFNFQGTVPEKLIMNSVNNHHETWEGRHLVVANDYIYELNEEAGRFELFMENELPEPIDIEQTKSGKIIVLTFSHGLFVINIETKEIIKRIKPEDGFASGINSDLMIDKAGNYWLLNALGLSRYNPETGGITNYYTDQGLLPSESEINYHFLTSDSTTYFPIWIGNTGVVSFNPNQLPTNSYSHSPVFTQVSAQDELLAASGEVDIHHTKNNVTLTYSNLAFQYPEKSEYRYAINDGEWSNWEASNQARLAQLSPGSYTFKVEARNADRIQASDAAIYRFTITPPWYQSTIAYWLYVLFGMSGLIAATVWYSNFRTRQEAIRMQAEQAEELAKLDRIKTNLLTNISHELRTPLTLINGSIEQLKSQTDTLGDGWQRRLNVARRNGDRLQQLVEQVLDLTRLDAQKMELEPSNIELTSLLYRVTESFGSMAESKNLTIKTQLPEQELWFQADADKLEKIIVNLLSNAIKFTPKEGTVELILTNYRDELKIEIRDTGRGINKEQLPHIFDRFHSTADQIEYGGKGIGVGLAITKEFVQQHDGTISVESQLGKWTVFAVLFPKKDYGNQLKVSPDEEEVTAETFKEEFSLPKIELNGEHEFTVLLVEDNTDMRSYITDLLSTENNLKVKVETAENGLSGKKKLPLVKPDIIISDVMMPEMDGFTFAEEVRNMSDFKLTPIILLSARAEVEDRVRGYEIGVSDYLAKPFNAQELKARVKNLLHLRSEREKYQQENGVAEESENIPLTLQQKLQAYVEDRLSDSNITVEELSDHVNMSRRQLYRKLKADTGYTPAEFIREIRMYKARLMLEDHKKMTVSEVGYAVGFRTPSYFSKLFKERFGRSPSEYN
ncbi:hybrid sensor histidine kinase/response regulator transcription factor [Gracilimonas mengyeensis]|uniref:histidine kinase n=1 Tax=Gracilimonas mengyeensis TaxID=1302730 RepID=A0A521FGQ3_9BACT|nr:hybrid sensor histidine kinase/response regulator transcription factor [Gracilimonas mengyeensis]SMO95363.1 Signal transduction histidine kinase [Gracilimonas mengyeensis]